MGLEEEYAVFESVIGVGLARWSVRFRRLRYECAAWRKYPFHTLVYITQERVRLHWNTACCADHYMNTPASYRSVECAKVHSKRRKLHPRSAMIKRGWLYASLLPDKAPAYCNIMKIPTSGLVARDSQPVCPQYTNRLAPKPGSAHASARSPSRTGAGVFGSL